jgi:tripartite-type tricarboxylate transporter receptor subunit TctC
MVEILGRLFQKPLERELGTRIFIECIPAGTTKVGTMEVVKAKPDGYTMVLMSDPSWVGYYYSKTYETKVWEILTPLGNLTIEPYGFVEVRAESPYKTWADLVRAAKESPGKLTCGGPGAGGMMELIFNDITRAAGINCKYVPFAGGGPSKMALLGGHIDFRTITATEAIAMIQAGTTRGLAVSSEKRLALIPDVPTFKELGIGEELWISRSLWGAPHLPAGIAGILTKAIEKGTKDREFIEAAEKLLLTVEFRGPERMKQELKNFDGKFGPKLAEFYR